jgi:glycosyltransferase involved in cell wall biosynthesis
MGIGGAERQMGYLVEGLAARGLDVHVIVAFPTRFDEVLRGAGVTLHTLGGKSKYDVRVLFRLFALLRRLRPDLVQTWLSQMDIFGGAAAVANGIPWVLSERSSAACYPSTPLNLARTAVAKRATAVVANSAGGAAYWKSRTPGRVEVVPNIVVREAIAGAPPVSSAPAGEIVLYAGRFGPEKNLQHLVEALGVVLPSRESVHAVFCGDGPLRATIERQVHERNLGDRVTFLGNVPDVWSWMKRAALVTSVGTYEGDPNVALEAIAAGTPLVVSDIPAHRDLLDAASAVFVDARDPDDIARGIMQGLDDREAAAARARRAERVLDGRTPGEIAARYDAIYQSLLRGAETPIENRRRLS